MRKPRLKGGASYGELIDKIKNNTIRQLSEPELDALIAASDLSLVDDRGFTPLMLACQQQLPRIASKLIKTGRSMPQHVSNQSFQMKYTALLLACNNELSDIALQLIETGQSNPGAAGGYYNCTPLLASCMNKMNVVAIKLIQTGESNPAHLSSQQENALLVACKHNMSDVASVLIKLDPSLAQCINENSITPLIYACQHGMSDVALQLIETNQSNPSVVQTRPFEMSGITALMYACFDDDMAEVAIKLIETGQSKPDAIKKHDDLTALLIACVHTNESIANKLIGTGQSLPGHVSTRGDTALIIACENQMTQTAVLLIETGDCNPDHKDRDGFTALDYAKRNQLGYVVQLLEILLSEPEYEDIEVEEDDPNQPRETININQTCLDLIMYDDVPMVEYLKEEGNAVFILYDQRVESSTKVGITFEQLEKSITDPYYVIYECMVAGTMRPDNIKKDTKYFDIKKLCGFGDLVPLQAMRQLLNRIKQNETSTTPNVFLFKKTTQHLTSTVSQAVLGPNANYVSARHCQEGQDAYVYALQPNPIIESTPITGGKFKRTSGYRSTYKKRQRRRSCRKPTHKRCQYRSNKRVTNKRKRKRKPTHHTSRYRAR